jgi:hypothetical protein
MWQRCDIRRAAQGARPDTKGLLRTMIAGTPASPSLGFCGQRPALRYSVADREPIGPHPVPFLDHEALCFEQGADLCRAPGADLFESDCPSPT